MGSARSPWRKVRVVVERLVVVLEQRVGASGHGIVPATRVPSPADTGAGQLVANSRVGEERKLRRRDGWLAGREDRVDRVITGRLGRQLAVFRGQPVGPKNRVEVLRAAVAHCVRVHRGARAHEPLVVEERTAESGVEEVVGQHIPGGLFRDRQLVGWVVAERQALGVADGDEFVHLAAVDLNLFLVVAVDQVSGLLVRANVLRDVERLVRQARSYQMRVGLRKARVRLAGCQVDLRGGRVARPADAVGAREETVQVVEAVVLVVDHHQVVDAGEAADVAVAAWAVTGSGRDRCKQRTRAHDGERADRKGQDTS